MDPTKLPVVTKDELRALWRAYRDPVVRSVILELVALREETERHFDVMRRTQGLNEIIRTVWREEVGGQLVALEHLKALVNTELYRLGQLPSERQFTEVLPGSR